jgi:hypothetical protein
LCGDLALSSNLIIQFFFEQRTAHCFHDVTLSLEEALGTISNFLMRSDELILLEKEGKSL